MNSSKFTHISSGVKWVRDQEGCMPCVRECVRGASQQCVRLMSVVMGYMDWHFHPPHEHAEHAGYDSDPH
eukprot:6350134-Alexandrium_andersonii.AAC.1